MVNYGIIRTMHENPKRNDRLFDKWSLQHILSGAVLCWLFGPVWAFVIATLWEPIEIFVLSPFLAKKGIVFGYETWRNSLSDIVFNSVGIAIVSLLS